MSERKFQPHLSVAGSQEGTMAKAAATLCVLLSYLWPTVQADLHILSCSFIMEARSIHTESLTQCSVDGVPFHFDDKDNTRKEGNAPKECEDLFSKLNDIKEELRSQLHTKELPGNLTMGDHSLLVTVVSQYKEGQPIYGYSNFTLDRQHFFGFNCPDSKNKKCALSPNNTRGIDNWKNNTNLLRHLETFIRGDSRRCFRKILSQSKEIAGSTSRTPDIGIVTSPSKLPSSMNATQFTSTMQPPSQGESGFTEGVSIVIGFGFGIVIVIGIVLAVIIYMMKRKSCPHGGVSTRQVQWMRLTLRKASPWP